MALNDIVGWSDVALHNPTSINGVTADQLLNITKILGLMTEEHVDDTVKHARIVASVAELRAPYTGNKRIVNLLGRSSIGDGCQGLFYWDNVSVADDNDGTIFKISDIEIGRWKRLHTDEIESKWFLSFEDCLTAMGSDEVTVKTSTPIDLDGAAITVLSNIHLKCNKGTMFSNGTLTIDDSFEAGLYQICDTDMTLLRGTGCRTTAYPQWFNNDMVKTFAIGGDILIPNKGSDYLTSVTLVPSSYSTITWENGAVIRLTEASDIGGVMSSRVDVKYVTLNNLQLDANNIPGENGIGCSTGSSHIRINGGFVKNAKHDGTVGEGGGTLGGRAFSIQMGANDIIYNNLRAENCYTLLDYHGIESPFWEGKPGVVREVIFNNAQAYNCEMLITGFSLESASFLPKTPQYDSIVISNVIGYNCGLDATYNTPSNNGIICGNRAGSAMISNIQVYNDDTYGVNNALVGSVTTSGVTATFVNTDTYNLLKVGSTIVADGITRTVVELLGSNQVTLNTTTSWSAVPITSIDANIGFTSTVSAVDTTATFNSTTDYNLMTVGTLITANGEERSIVELLGSNQVTLNTDTDWTYESITKIRNLPGALIKGTWYNSQFHNIAYYGDICYCIDPSVFSESADDAVSTYGITNCITSDINIYGTVGYIATSANGQSTNLIYNTFNGIKVDAVNNTLAGGNIGEKLLTDTVNLAYNYLECRLSKSTKVIRGWFTRIILYETNGFDTVVGEILTQDTTYIDRLKIFQSSVGQTFDTMSDQDLAFRRNGVGRIKITDTGTEVQLKMENNPVSNPPTLTQLTAIFGPPSDHPATIFLANSGGLSDRVYFVLSDGVNYRTIELPTKAV